MLLLRALSGIEGESEGERVAGSSSNSAIGGFFLVVFPWENVFFFFAPRGVPRWSPNRTKISAKMDTTNRCVLDVHFGRFFWILKANVAPKWRQVGHPKRIVVKLN